MGVSSDARRQDTWVLERLTNRKGERWHLLETLPLPAGYRTIRLEQEERTAKDKAERAAAARADKEAAAAAKSKV